jgi:hypothetical protein
METRPEPAKIIFLGNSITLSIKNPALGWMKDAGMAASIPENDYVHQTVRILREKGLDVEGLVGPRDCEFCDGPIEEHIENLWQVREVRPRYVVVQLGENSDLTQIRSGKLTQDYLRLLQGLKDNGAQRIFCLSNWDEDSLSRPHNEAILKAIHHFHDIHVVDITSLADDPANRGDSTLYANVDVRWHPGDLGMLRIATILANSILEDP